MNSKTTNFSEYYEYERLRQENDKSLAHIHNQLDEIIDLIKEINNQLKGQNE